MRNEKQAANLIIEALPKAHERLNEPAQSGDRPLELILPAARYAPRTAWYLIRLGALATVMVGFALRLHALARESLWFDELLQLDIAQGPLSAIIPQLTRHTAVPLDYFIIHFWIWLGRSDAWVRLPAVMWGVLTLPLAYQLGRSLLGLPGGKLKFALRGGKVEGLLLMSLLAISPFHLRYSQEVRPYALVVLGVTLAGYAFWRLQETGRRRYLVGLQIGALIFSLAHIFGVVIFGPFFMVAGLGLIFERNRKRALQALTGLLGAGLVVLALLLAMGWAQVLYHNTKNFGGALIEPGKFTVDAAEEANRSPAPQVDRFFITYEVLAPLGAGVAETSLWLFNGLAGLGLVYLLVQKRYKLSLLLLLWLLLPTALIVAFLVYRGEFFASRYIISSLPAYLMLLAVGILALPRWLKCAEPRWLSAGALLLFSGLVWTDLAGGVQQFYQEHKKEDWRLVSQFLAQNAGPDDAIMVVNAESTLNWYYPPAAASLDSFDQLERIQATVARAERSWVVVSFFSTYLGEEYSKIRVWLGEQGAIPLPLDPVITVYYLGPEANPPQLLTEIQGFALPVNHALYAGLARENRRNPAAARQYYQLAIEHAPTDEIRAEYQAALEDLGR